MKKLILMMSIVAGVSMFSSCSNDDSTSPTSGDYSYKVRLTDAPGPYDSVNIDVRAVEVIDGNGNTVTLNTVAGIHNLLELTNGADMLLASSNLQDSEVKQIRLILGSNSTVVVDDVSYPLSTPSAEQSGLKIMVNQTLEANANNEILIDFDANASIIQTGNGTYKLKPVLRTIDTSITGSISGTVTNSSLAVVTATSSSNVNYSTGLSANGNFRVVGLPPGSYTLTVTPLLPLTPVTQTNVVVQAGQTTSVTSIIF